MGREETKKAKEIEKRVIKAIRGLNKSYDTKLISGFLYRQMEAFLVSTIVYVSYIEGNYCICGTLSIKPMALDDLFWEIFEIPENKNAPMSLRVNGAFVAPSIQTERIEFPIDPEGSMESHSANFLEQFNERCRQILGNIEKHGHYKNYMLNQYGYAGNALHFILIEMALGHHESAFEMIAVERQNNRSSGFGTSDKDFYDFAIAYCKRFMSIHQKQ